MAIAVVDSESESAATLGGNCTTSPGIDLATAPAVLLVGGSVFIDSNGQVFDSASNTTWTYLTQRTNGTSTKARMAYVSPSPTVSGTHTLSLNATGPTAAIGLAFAGFSGILNSADAFDQESGTTATGPTISPGSITPSEAGSLFVTIACGRATSGGPSINDGFSIIEAKGVISGQSLSIHMAWKVGVGTTAANPQWSGLDGGALASCMACFKPAPSAGGSVPLYFSHLMRMRNTK